MPLDVNAGGNVRPGGVPIHVVSGNAPPTIAGAPGLKSIGAVIAGATHTVRTFDPFAGLNGFRRAIGKRLAK
jgi:hypothetical protein